MKFGLIGYPLGHSFSKKFFEEKFRQEGLVDFSYDLYPVRERAEIEPILHSGIFGLNVTVPFKSVILDLLQEVDEIAFRIGAVNVLVYDGDRWIGFNTDYLGFKESFIVWLKGQSLPRRALILGTGGASKAIRFALLQLAIPSATVSSQGKGDYSYDGLTDQVIQEHDLIINATPLGTFPDTEHAPAIPYHALTSKHRLFDLVYNPANTLFLARGSAAGAKTKNGLDMLHLQAEHAWLIWKKYGRF